MAINRNKFLEFTSGTLWCEETVGSTPAEGAGTRFMWVPEKKAFRAGYLSVAESIFNFDPNLFTAWDHDNLGEGSVAFGLNTMASSRFSFAIGDNVISEGQGNIAAGRGSRNKGQYSFLLGNDSVLGTHVNGSPGSYSLSIGTGSTSGAISSLQIGKDISLGLQADNSLALGERINIGDLNHSVFAFGSNLNIGGPYEPIPSPGIGGTLAISSMVFGSFINLSENAPYSAVLPSDSSELLGDSSFSLLRGCGNRITDSEFSAVQGFASSLNNAATSTIYGSNNHITDSTNSQIFGYGNITVGSYSSKSEGVSNVIDSSSSSFSFGYLNRILGSASAVSFGMDHVLQNSSFSFASGWSHNVIDSPYLTTFGLDTNSTTSARSTVFGLSNTLV